jgi:hypothetical protein
MFLRKFLLLCVVLFVSLETFSQAEFVRLCTLPNLRGRCVNVVANINQCRNVPGRPQVYRSLLIQRNTNVATWGAFGCRGQRVIFRGSSGGNRRLNIRPRVIRSVRITRIFRNAPTDTTPVEKKEKEVNVPPQSGAADKKEKEDTNTPNAPSTPQAASDSDIESAFLQDN